jgi:AbrB family looped-hinge helix DNA binding protein
MTTELTVTAKGQVTLKKSLLEHLGVKPGDRLVVSMKPNGHVELEPSARRRDISGLRGLLWKPDQPVVTLEEMQDAIAMGAVTRYRRSL